MDLRNIRTFIQVAEQKNFTKVANEMNYVQSTVTMQIQQLERELGYPLFDRIGKTVSLTAMGEAFLPQAYEILQILHKASDQNRDLSEVSGTLWVGAQESLLFSTVVDALPGYQAQFPNLELQIKMGQAAELLEQLKQNRLDMIYISAGMNTDPDLSCPYQREERLVFLAGGKHPLARRKKIPVSELLEHDFVVTERSGICYGKLRELAAQNNAKLRASIEVDSTIAIAKLLKMGKELAFLPEYSAKNELVQGQLVALNVDIGDQIYYSQILCHKKRWVSPFMAAFIDSIKNAAPTIPDGVSVIVKRK